MSRVDDLAYFNRWTAAERKLARNAMAPCVATAHQGLTRHSRLRQQRKGNSRVRLPLSSSDRPTRGLGWASRRSAVINRDIIVIGGSTGATNALELNRGFLRRRSIFRDRKRCGGDLPTKVQRCFL